MHCAHYRSDESEIRKSYWFFVGPSQLFHIFRFEKERDEFVKLSEEDASPWIAGIMNMDFDDGLGPYS